MPTNHRRMRALLAMASMLAAGPVAAAFAAATGSDRADALLAAARATTGGAAWDQIRTWDEHGRVSAGGLTGTYETVADFPSQRQMQSYVLGPDRGSQGWDGRAAWSTDASGQMRVERSREAEAGAIQQVYLTTETFFFPSRWPAERAYAGVRHDGGRDFEAIRLTPKGAEPVELWFDGATHRIDRAIQLTGSQPQTFLLGSYVAEGGVQVPGRVITRVGGNSKFDTVSEIDRVEVNGAVPASRFAPPPAPAYDAVFPAGRTSVTVPIRLLNNHIYLDVSINGRPAVPFMFDTGAVNFFDSAHAARMGVKAEGALPGGGFGSDIASTSLARVASVSIGGLTLHDQVFAAEDIGRLIAVEGTECAGLVGYEFAKRAVTTIDYGARTMTFTRPEAFAPPAAPPIPFVFEQHVPMVQASVDGVPGEFEIDTGARSALTLMHPFAEAHGLVAKYHAVHVATTGYGVGGPSRALLARVGVLAIGPVAVAEPVTDLVMDRAGAAAAARTAGNIGGDILKRFTVTLDYGHQTMWLQPNALAGQRDVFDRSGIWITRGKDGGIGIADVSPDGAAARAGLKTGERILAVDGRPASGIALPDLREAFKRAPGTRFMLSVDGGGAGPRVVRLVLADQV